MKDIYKLYCIHMNRGILQFCFINIYDNESTTNKLILNIDEIKSAISSSQYILEGIEGLLDNTEDWVYNSDYTLVKIDGIKQEVYGEAITYLRCELIGDNQYIIWCNYAGELFKSKSVNILKIRQACCISNIEIDTIPTNTTIVKHKDGELNHVFKITNTFSAHIYYKNNSIKRNKIKVNNIKTKGFRYNEFTKIFEIYDNIEKLDIYEEINKYLHSGKITIQLADDIVSKNQVKIKEFSSTYINNKALDIEINIPKECTLHIENFFVKEYLSINTTDSNIVIDNIILQGDNTININGLNVTKVNSVSIIRSSREQSIGIQNSFNNCDIAGKFDITNIVIDNSFNNSNVNIIVKSCWLIIKNSFNNSTYKSTVDTVKIDCLGSFNQTILKDTKIVQGELGDSNYENRLLYNNANMIELSFSDVEIKELILYKCHSILNSFNIVKIHKVGVLKHIESIDKSFNNMSISQPSIIIGDVNITESFKNIDQLEEIIFRESCKLAYGFNECRNLKSVKFETNRYIMLSESFINTQVSYLEVYESLELKNHVGCGDITLDVCGGRFGWYNGDIIADKIHIKNVTTIGSSSMGFKCKAELTIDDTVREIGYSAFKGAWLRKIDLWHLDKVKYIRNNTFEGCKASIIVLPKNIEKIEDRVFKNCLNLTHLVMNSTIKEINTNAFGDLLKDSKNFSTNTYPNIYVFKGSVADKFFTRRRIPVIYIENIDDAYDIIYDRKNTSLKMAKLLLRDAKFTEYRTDSRFANSLDVIYNLDNIINEQSDDDSTYINIPKYINVPVCSLDKPSKILPSITDNSVNKARFNIACAFLFKCTTPLKLDLKMYNIFSNFYYLGHNVWYSDITNKNYIFIENYAIHNKDGADGACFQLVMVIQSGIVIYATIIDKVSIDAQDKTRIRYGSNNIFCFYDTLALNKEYQHKNRQMSLLNLLKRGDVLNRYEDSCKISGKNIPNKLSNEAFKHFLGEMILVYSERVSRIKRKQTKAYFISTVNLHCIEAFIDIAGIDTQNIDNIKSIIINEIYDEIPKNLFKTIRNINNCEKVQFVQDCLNKGYDLISYQNSVDSYQSTEYLVGKYLTAKGIEGIEDIKDINDLYIILSTGFCKEIEKIDKKLEQLINNRRYKYNIEGNMINIESLMYCKENYLFKTIDKNSILWINCGNTTKLYSLMMPINKIISNLREIGRDYTDNVQNNTQMSIAYINSSELVSIIKISTQWSIYKIGFHRVTKRVYLLLYKEYSDKYIPLLIFNDFKAMITEIERLNDIDQKYIRNMLENIITLNWAFNQNYSSRFYISDSVQDLWKLVSKQPKIENKP
ncbi:MAG: leucine-rich repeat protein [Lachnospiraceae bacterium]|nr:leucine-rich repeat protein [Lachnospiraceae bacterium]